MEGVLDHLIHALKTLTSIVGEHDELLEHYRNSLHHLSRGLEFACLALAFLVFMVLTLSRR